jgi:hypothetical protein
MNAERLAAENGIEIQYLRKKNLRQEELVQAILAKRGSRLGLVAIFLGHGGLLDLSALAQPADRQNLFKAGRRLVLTLLFLLSRRRTGLDLCPGAPLVAVPFADLL